MILLWAVVIGLAATTLRARLYHRTLKLSKLRWEWLVLIAAIPQIFLFQIPATAKWFSEALIPPVQVITMVGLVIFASANISAPGFWALWLGLTSNFMVIAFNSGWMPISVETLSSIGPDHPINRWINGTRLAFTKDRILTPAETNLVWLSDRLILPQWLPVNIAFSIGDIFISIGTIILLWSLSRNEKE